MTKPRASRLPPKRWMLLAVIQDSPRSGEDYLTEQDIRDLALTNDLIEGMRFSKIKLQPFPPRVKTGSKSSKSTQNEPVEGKKTLDKPPTSGVS